MRDQVVALKNKTNRMVAVSIPFTVGKRIGRLAVYFELTGCVSVKSAYDVQQRRLSTARGTENGHELAVAEGERHALQRLNGRVSRDIAFSYLL